LKIDEHACYKMSMSVGPIEVLNEISTFLVKETNSLWRTLSSGRRDDIWADLISWQRRL